MISFADSDMNFVWKLLLEHLLGISQCSYGISWDSYEDSFKFILKISPAFYFTNYTRSFKKLLEKFLNVSLLILRKNACRNLRKILRYRNFSRHFNNDSLGLLKKQNFFLGFFRRNLSKDSRQSPRRTFNSYPRKIGEIPEEIQVWIPEAILGKILERIAGDIP